MIIEVALFAQERTHLIDLSEVKVLMLRQAKDLLTIGIAEELSRPLRSFSAFHCLGLWLAVRMIPPSASFPVTAISVVGVVASPISMTSHPIPRSVPVTMWLTMIPEMRASRPTTIRGRALPECLRMKAA